MGHITRISVLMVVRPFKYRLKYTATETSLNLKKLDEVSTAFMIVLPE